MLGGRREVPELSCKGGASHLFDLRREGAPPDVKLDDRRVAVHAHDHNPNLPSGLNPVEIGAEFSKNLSNFDGIALKSYMGPGRSAQRVHISHNSQRKIN